MSRCQERILPSRCRGSQVTPFHFHLPHSGRRLELSVGLSTPNDAELNEQMTWPNLEIKLGQLNEEKLFNIL